MRKQEEQSRNTNQDLYLPNNVDVVDHQLGSGHDDDDDDKDNDIDRTSWLWGRSHTQM